jgi:hypothetical protein
MVTKGFLSSDYFRDDSALNFNLYGAKFDSETKTDCFG